MFHQDLSFELTAFCADDLMIGLHNFLKLVFIFSPS